MTYPRFTADILRMNGMYKLATIAPQWEAQTKRMAQFEDILTKECVEIKDIKELLATANDANWPAVRAAAKVMFADLLADLIVYCASEAERWEIPLADVLQLIMLSNFSKLGADGQPIINPDNGKFEKGPNYWKPEPAIAHLLTYGPKGLLVSVDGNGVPTLKLETPPSREEIEAVLFKPDMDAVTKAALADTKAVEAGDDTTAQSPAVAQTQSPQA